MSKKVKRVAIIGHGSHARMLKQLLIESGYFFSGFIEIKKSTNFNRNKKDEVIGDLNSIMNIKKKFDYVVLGIGDNIKRYQIFENLKKKNVNIFTYIHHSAYVSKFSKIGTGSVVLIGSKINANAKIDEACIINTGSIIEHDCHIKKGSHICPGSFLAGNVTVGRKSMVGIGSAIIQNLKIGDNVIIGAKTVVLKNVKNNSKVIEKN